LFWVVFFLVALVVGVGLMLVQRQLAVSDQIALDPASGQRLMYGQTRPLTDPEQVLYWRLVEALPECVILAQVSFSRFMKPTPPEGVLEARQYRALFFRISQKTVDFLVCLKDFTVVAAVELDDSTHADVDLRREQLLQSAGIPLVRLRVDHIPTVERLREMFTAK
jgi:hypothetical protein